MNEKAPLKVLQISDTHLFGEPDKIFYGIDTNQSLEAVIEAVNLTEAKPDLVLVTGDLSQDETPESYRILSRQLAAFDCPVYCLPGNHDVAATMDLWLAGSAGPVKADKSVLSPAWQIILLNTALEGEASGYLAEAELARLDKLLQQFADRHALIALHHPPVAIAADWLDNIALQNKQDFLHLIAKHENVRLVLFGHVHQEFCRELDGVAFLSCPSTAVQFKRSPKFALDEENPGWRYLELYADGRLKSRVGRVANFKQKANPLASGY